MTRIATKRLLGQLPFSILCEKVPVSRGHSLCLRPFSQTSRRKAVDDELPRTPSTTPEVSDRPTVPLSTTADSSKTLSFPPSNAKAKPASEVDNSSLSSASSPPAVTPPRSKQSAFGFNRGDTPSSTQYGQKLSPEEANKRLLNLSTHMLSEQQTTKWPSALVAASGGAAAGSLYAHMSQESFREDTWQMHIYAHRHNLHSLVNRPPAWRDPESGKVYGATPVPHRTPALSLTAGSLGFRKSGRKHFDTAFQLGAYAMARMKESGMTENIEFLEVYLRGYGQGREAVTRILLGPEGRAIRNKIIKVADATRLKFGGTRSKKPRRLG